MPHHNPWRELGTLAHVTIHYVRLAAGMWGATDGERTIWLDERLGQVERRCTLAHELEHIRRGHRGCQDAATERKVDADAARRLLPDPHVVADALVYTSGDLAAAAAELWVVERTLRARLDRRHLHPAEQAIISRRCQDIQHA